MAQTNEYREQIREQSILKIREMLKDMPDYTATYMRGISQSRMATTRFAYLVDIRTFMQWLTDVNPLLDSGNLKCVTLEVLENLKSDDFEAYLEWLDNYSKDGAKRKNEVKSKRRKFSALRSLYAYLYKNEYISANPIIKVDMPDSRQLKHHEVIALEPNEAADLLDNVDSAVKLSDHARKLHDKYRLRDMAIITLLLSTGVRVSECVGLNLDDVNLEEQSIRVIRKGNFADTVYFNQEALDALTAYIEGERSRAVTSEEDKNALFLSNRSTRITVRSVERLVTKYASSAVPGKHISSHKLRSSCATLMINNNVPIDTVKNVLGHQSIATTQLYVKENEAAKRRAAYDLKLRDK